MKGLSLWENYFFTGMCDPETAYINIHIQTRFPKILILERTYRYLRFPTDIVKVKYRD